MKSRLELWTNVLADASAQCHVTQAHRSLETAAMRLDHEGDGFFTIALPAFGKAFEKALGQGFIDESMFVGWSKNRFLPGISPDGQDDDSRETRRTGTPKFLGEFIDFVFDPFTGVIRTPEHGNMVTPDVESQADYVWAVRQLTLLFGKVKQDCGPERNSQAYSAYVRTDQEIAEHLDAFTSSPNWWHRVELLKKSVRVLFGEVLSQMERKLYEGDLVPKHGPGATADRLRGNAKFHQLEWTERLEGLFPFGEYAIPNFRYHQEVVPQVNFLNPADERPVRVVLVPKTVTTPRVIAIEPTCMQYMQQAVGRALTDLLETRTFPGGVDNPASWFLGFTNQVPNQLMALVGSEDGSLATLDLSEASDRVANWLVEVMFEDFPWFAEAIQVCRSLRADVPEHGVIPLHKYASMGSALTFPIEAMVFLAVAFVGMSESAGVPMSRKFVRTMRDRVRIYGDDIIVPNGSALPVVAELEAFGFRVNRSKSFWSGSFRESCGKEFFKGQDVSIVRFRSELPARRALRKDIDTDFANCVVSTVSTRNQLYNAGLWLTAGGLDQVLEVVLDGHYPYVGPDSSLLGRHSFLLETLGEWDDDLHVPLVRGYQVTSRLPVNPAEDYAALLKSLLVIGGDAETQKDHLQRSGRPRAVGIKRVTGTPH